MTADEERIRYLGGEAEGGALAPEEQRELDAVRALLADESLWAEPPGGLEDRVVAAVVGDAAGAPARGAAGGRRRRPGALIGAVAAAAAIVVVAVVVAGASDDDGTDLAAELVPGDADSGAGASGYAGFTSTDAGWRIELDASGLPRLDDGRFYQAWLRDGDGAAVTVGTFNEPDGVVLWAGVSPLDFPTITVTEERVDDGPESSGRVVLVGSIAPP